MTHRYVNDAVSLADDFGTIRVGDQVARMALDAQPPFTLGVTGKWGSGKTSVLRRAFVTLGGRKMQRDRPLSQTPMAEAEAEDWKEWRWDAENRRPALDWEDVRNIAERSLAIWYSPWQHQGADNPLVPLLREIQAQFTVWMKTKEKLTEINRRGGLAGLALLERVIDGAASLAVRRRMTIAQGTSDAVRQAWREAAPEEPGLSDGQRFHLLFEDAVKTLLGGLSGEEENKQGRLVLFIDDLDRCEESVVVELLEAIKLYLGTEHCVFVLAIDEGAVLEALKRHWQGRPEDSNREYLEKLFQAIVEVPPPREVSVKEFIAGQFDAHGVPGHEECAEMVAELLEPNPRKIKNFVNGACATWRLFEGTPIDAEAPALHARRFLLFHYLRTHHKAVWRLLVRQPWSLRLLTRVLNHMPEQEIELPKNVDVADQRLLQKLFSRAFVHVLRAEKEDDDDLHRRLPLAEAVRLFTERIDRKRSDDSFVSYYKSLITKDMDLGREFLHLPDPEDGAGDG